VDVDKDVDVSMSEEEDMEMETDEEGGGLGKGRGKRTRRGKRKGRKKVKGKGGEEKEAEEKEAEEKEAEEKEEEEDGLTPGRFSIVFFTHKSAFDYAEGKKPGEGYRTKYGKVKDSMPTTDFTSLGWKNEADFLIDIDGRRAKLVP